MDKDTMTLDIDSVNFVAYLTVKEDRLKSERTADYINRNMQDLELLERLAPKGWSLQYRRDSHGHLIAKVRGDEITYTLDLAPEYFAEAKAAVEEAQANAEEWKSRCHTLEDEAMAAGIEQDNRKEPAGFSFKQVAIGATALAATVAIATWLLKDA